jgi:hypothetical protein
MQTIVDTIELTDHMVLMVDRHPQHLMYYESRSSVMWKEKIFGVLLTPENTIQKVYQNCLTAD